MHSLRILFTYLESVKDFISWLRKVDFVLQFGLFRERCTASVPKKCLDQHRISSFLLNSGSFVWLFVLFFSCISGSAVQGQGFIQFPPLAAGATYNLRELPDGGLLAHGNHSNFSFNAQATLSSYVISPQGYFIGVNDSLRNNSTNDYWLWLPNSDHLLTFKHDLTANPELTIERFLVDSQMVFQKTFAFPLADELYFGNVLELRNDDLFVFGFVDTSTTIYSPDLVCMRLDSKGDTIWTRNLLLFPGQDVVVDAFLSEIVEIANGDICFVLMVDSKPLFVRLKPDGSIVYRFFLNTLELSANPAGAIAQDGTMFITLNDAPSGTLYLLMLDGNAQVVWQIDLRAKFGAEVDLAGAYQILLNNDGNAVFAGTMLENGTKRKLYIAEFEKANGDLLKVHTYSGLGDEPVRMLGSRLLTDGSLAFCGTYKNTPIVLRTDALGQLLDGCLKGRVAFDQNNNCLAESNEPGVRNWTIEAKSTQKSYFTVTDTLGNYHFEFLDSAEYTIQATHLNYTVSLCPANTNLTVGHDTIIADFALKTEVSCPRLKLDISAPFVRHCDSNTWSVEYENLGSDTAHQVRIEIILDPALEYETASIPPAAVNGQNLTFLLPDLPPSHSNTFRLFAKADCNLTAVGRNVCLRAHIYPDSICNPAGGAWNGASIEAIPICQNDTAKFVIKNIGLNATGAFDYIIIEDHIVLRTVPTNLAPGEVQIIQQPNASGGTIRFVSPQVPGHPLPIRPSVALEGCTQSLNASLGLINQWPNATGNPFADIFCEEVVASILPSEKTPYPLGFDSEHIIEQNTPIEYRIRFQNTGTDTSFRIVVIDTLSPFLDMASVLPGASSHPFQYMPMGANTLAFIFDSIALPDSTSNANASHGFIQFWVNQKKDVPKGTVIENLTHIYFDSGAEAYTNKTKHLIKDIKLAIWDPPVYPNFALRLSPNPTTDILHIEWQEGALHDAQLYISDLKGNVVQIIQMPSNTTTINLKEYNFAQGMYVVSLLEHGSLFASKKLILSTELR